MMLQGFDGICACPPDNIVRQTEYLHATLDVCTLCAHTNKQYARSTVLLLAADHFPLLLQYHAPNLPDLSKAMQPNRKYNIGDCKLNKSRTS
jgi:hypothetical protein